MVDISDDSRFQENLFLTPESHQACLGDLERPKKCEGRQSKSTKYVEIVDLCAVGHSAICTFEI